MTQQVNAIYDHGVLRLLGPLDLRDQEVVTVSVDKVAPSATEGEDHGPTFFEMLDEVGLVGYVKGAPSDLSSNPRHLKGFGQNGS